MAAKHALWLNRTLFISPYCIALCTSEKDFHLELKRMKLPPHAWPPFLATNHANATTHWFEAPSGHKPAIIVCMAEVKGIEPEQYYSMLVHEAVHVFQKVCDRIGEDHPSAEFEAYSIQAISQELMYAWKNRKRK